MWRRAALVAVASVTAMAALAGGRAGTYRPPASAATGDRGALRLPAVDRCVARSVRLGVVPPSGGFASLTVRVAGEEVLQLTSLHGPGSVKMVLPYGRSRVRAAAIAADGGYVQVRRGYRRCRPDEDAPRPAPTAAPPPVSGGGEG